MRKKILYILDFLSYGGVERITYDFLKNVNNPKFSFEVLALCGGLFEEEFESNIPNFSIAPRRKLKIVSDILFIRKFVKKESIQLIHSHNIKGAFICWLATQGLNVKLIRSFHHFGTIDYKHNWMNLFLMKHFNLNLFVSSSFREDYAKRLWVKELVRTRVIYNGIDFSRFNLNGTSVHNELNISKDIPVLGMVGNFVSMKDQLTVCKALKIIQDRGLDFNFIFAGSHDGIHQHYLYDCIDFCKENNLSDKVFFLGFRSDVPKLVNTMDLFIFSSIGDTFGLALVEALGAGVPVISSNIRPSKEITNDGEFITLFQTGNVYQLAEKISDFYINREHFFARALQAKQYVRERFTILNHIEETLDAYNSVLND